MRLRPLAALLLAGTLLAGCATSPEAQLREALGEVTERANDNDAAGLRTAVDELTALVARQKGTDLEAGEADRVLAAAAAVRAAADLLEAPVPPPGTVPTASASPSRTPSASPTPSASRSPSPSPTPSPTRSPTPSPTPSPTATPSRTPSPTPTTTTSPAAAVVTPPAAVVLPPSPVPTP